MSAAQPSPPPPPNADELLELATNLLLSDDPSAARDPLEEVVRANPGNACARADDRRRRRGRCPRGGARAAAARVRAARSLSGFAGGELDESVGSQATAWYNLGAAREAADDLPGASDAYREAARLEPDAADARLNLAGVLQRQGAPLRSVEAEARRAFARDADMARRRATRLARFRPRPWDRDWAETLEDLWFALKARNFSRAVLRTRVDVAGFPTYASGRDWHELRLSLSTTALDALEDEPLGVLLLCFVVGVAVDLDKLAAALGAGGDQLADALVRSGLLVRVANRAACALQLFPLEDDVVATAPRRRRKSFFDRRTIHEAPAASPRPGLGLSTRHPRAIGTSAAATRWSRACATIRTSPA